MDILNFGIKVGIYALMAGTLLLAVGVVTLRNLFHSALCLAATLIGTAALYLVFHAEFLAAVQILLYVGAVVTVIIFAIMLTEHIAERSVAQRNRQSLPALLGILVLIAVTGRILLKTPWAVNPATVGARVTVADLGAALMGTYVFPFELVSVILIAALIGAVIVAKKEKSS
jgi:NADH-quinone oxidoreductase subunit J